MNLTFPLNLHETNKYGQAKPFFFNLKCNISRMRCDKEATQFKVKMLVTRPIQYRFYTVTQKDSVFDPMCEMITIVTV